MPKTGLFEHLKIFPSRQSELGLEYEVANAATIPNLGERRLEVWTEGATQSKLMNIQVADVHKPLLSLSRCADMGFESRFGKHYGALVDVENGDVTPLHRHGQLYFLRVWVRSVENDNMKNVNPPFGGPR